MLTDQGSKLYLDDVQQMYRCGRSKAALVLSAVGRKYVGRTPYIEQEDLDRYVEKHGGVIRVRWPKRREKR